MIDYFFELKDIIPYLYGFPVYLMFLFVFFFIGKRKIHQRGIAFYGVFMGLSTKNVMSLAFLFLYYYFVMISIFVNTFSFLTLLLLIVPILLFNIINFYFFKFFVDIVNTLILFLLLFSKDIFYNYMIDVGSYWYVVLLYAVLCVFIFLYATYVFIRRFKSIISSNKYVESVNKR